jgi:hypothetical protein
MKNFRARARKLRQKMSNCAFNQGDGPNAEDLLTDALELTYEEGRSDVLDAVQIILNNAKKRKQEENAQSSESQDDAHDYSRGC